MSQDHRLIFEGSERALYNEMFRFWYFEMVEIQAILWVLEQLRKCIKPQNVMDEVNNIWKKIHILIYEKSLPKDKLEEWCQPLENIQKPKCTSYFVIEM